MRRGVRVATLLGAVALGGCANSVLVFAADDAGSEDETDAGVENDAMVEADGGAGQREEAGVKPVEAGSGEGARAVAAHTHSCAATDEGAFCWGNNSDGQLGIGADEAPLSAPARVMGGAAYVQLCAAEAHSCGLRSDGAIDCWGGNAKGQLGIGSRGARDFPTRVAGELTFKWLACGGLQTCAVGRDEQVYCWGHNLEGQGGQADAPGAADLFAPTRVMLEEASAQVAVGQGHVCALSVSGALSCWGRNNEGQLGLPRSADMQIRRPTPLPGSSAYMSIAAGQLHSCAVRRDRRLFCWGDSFDGRLGLGADVAGTVFEPRQVGNFSDWQSVQVDWFHSCGLRAGGVLMCWGRNAEGQLGIGNVETRHAPALVNGLEGVHAFSVGQFHTCASASGGTYCWGKNEYGQLGLGLRPSDRAHVPTRVALVPQTP